MDKEIVMPLTCNIDDKGARVRRVWGVMCLMIAALLAAMAYWSGTWWLWMIVAVVFGLGVLGLFEARKKWCVMRAMGVKTPT
jgi:hypothetical protein